MRAISDCGRFCCENSWRGHASGSVSISHLLAVEHDGGEDDDCHGEGEDEEAQLGGARLQRVAQDAQTLRVPRKLEDAEHTEHPKSHEGPRNLV